jgi:hydroxymethylglutaryl-CoA lyase
MANGQGDSVVITDVTLREYGQNVPAGYLHVFSPEMRVKIASRLVDAGLAHIEILSCVHPSAAPAMNEGAIRGIAEGLGKATGVHFITLVPNRAGYRNFLDMGLGSRGYDHTMGIFFSAVEAHNLANLGRPLNETLGDYEIILKDAQARKIRVIAYVSAAFGYMDPVNGKLIRPGVEDINRYINIMLGLGVETVTLSDLQGVADEGETDRLLKAILNKRKARDVEKLGYHPHHISGEKAIANSQVAYDLGIRRFDASLGGTGGCITGAPGNQPTEVLVQHFNYRGIKTGLDGGKISSLAQWVQKEVYDKIPLAPLGVQKQTHQEEFISPGGSRQ